MTPLLRGFFLLACVVTVHAAFSGPYYPSYNIVDAYKNKILYDIWKRLAYTQLKAVNYGYSNYGYSNNGYQNGFRNVGINGLADTGYRQGFSNYQQNFYGQKYGYQNSLRSVLSKLLAKLKFMAWYKAVQNKYGVNNGYQNDYSNIGSFGSRYNNYEQTPYGNSNYGYNRNFGSLRLIGPFPVKIRAPRYGNIRMVVPVLKRPFRPKFIVGDGPFPGYKLVGPVRVRYTDQNRGRRFILGDGPYPGYKLVGPVRVRYSDERTKQSTLLRKRLAFLRLLQQCLKKRGPSRFTPRRPTATDLYHGRSY